MKILPPVSIEGRRLLPSRWDLLAALLVLGFIVLFADVSRGLVQPLSTVTGGHLSLDPALLTAEELAWLNGYHARVLREVGPHLDAATASWLKQACAVIERRN